MIYSYIRISTDKQTTENQRFEIEEFAKQKNTYIDKWIEETASGTKSIENRKLGKLLKTMKCYDILIVSELSRLGRNLMQIMGILNLCMEKKIKIVSIKERCEFGDDINSKVLAFAFGLSAEIERNLISQRTKEALARRRSEGMKLGRPKGSCNIMPMLENRRNDIRDYLEKGISKSKISKKLHVSRGTLNIFIKKSDLFKN